MSEQKKRPDVSKEDRENFHRALDTIWDKGEARGVFLLCAAFQEDGMSTAICTAGALRMGDVIQAIAKGGGHLLSRMESQCADQPESGVWQ